MRSFVKEPEIEGPVRWRVVGKLIPYLMAYRGRVTLAMSLLVFAKLAGVGLPLVFKEIVDAMDISTLDENKLELIVVPLALLLVYGLLRFFNVFLSELRDAVFSRVTERAQRAIGLEVFRHLHNLDLEFHLSRQTGGLSRDIERGTRGINFLLRFGLFNIVPTFLEIALVTGILLMNYDAIFALVALVSVVAYVTFSVYATEWRTEFVRQANLMDSTANTRAVDALLNFETVKYFGNERYEAELYDQSLLNWESARVKNRVSLALLNSGQAFIIAGGITVMMVLAARQIASGAMGLGDLVLVNAFMIQLFIPLNVLGFIYREIKASLADINTMFDLLEQQPSIRDKADAQQLDDGSHEIEFRKVSFRYHPERPIINDVSFTIRPGEKLALVGRSGSGKSTLGRLLFRFYDVTDGEILVDGVDVRDLTQDSLRRQIGVVPQDTVLFNDTIQHNIQYGLPTASAECIDEALAFSQLSEFVEKLPNGLQTKVGERGLKVSGGEKQRIAIARVVLKNPQILIFDEATSSLDSESERAISDALATVARDHTALVIAHRLSTVVDADRILVLDEGRVVEQGSHASLLQKDGLYTQLWERQRSGIDT